jgi:hypothetical protein
MSGFGHDSAFGGNPAGDGDYPNSADPDDVYDEVPIHDVADGEHEHAHRAFGLEGADAADFHSHPHEHADGNSHDHHDHGPTSSSGRRPSGGVHRRSRDWGEPSDLSSRLTAAADETAQIQRDMYRCHEALMANEAELETPQVLAERDELQRVWHRLSQQVAQAHSRLRVAQFAWKQVERDFTFAKEGEGSRGGVQMEPWERQLRAERENGLSNVDRDRR